MAQYIFVGCDLHDRNLVLQCAVDSEEPQRRSFHNTTAGRKALIAWLQKLKRSARATKVVFAYEASGQGFTLCDELTAAGIICHVVPPTRVPRSPHDRKNKNDPKDALRMLSLLRNHYLAGDDLPSVWIPDTETRDDRELTRGRLDLTKQLTSARAKVATLLKRYGIEKPDSVGTTPWSKRHRRWMHGLLKSCPKLGKWGAFRLDSLLRQAEQIEAELALFDAAFKTLAQKARYARAVPKLTAPKGVSLTTALVFLTELGDPTRFANRRKLAAYFGLTPSKQDSGEATDRNGHITHQGSPRVRHVLGQAAWAWVRLNPSVKRDYNRLVAKNPKKRKIAVVAMMRRLAIRLWHWAVETYEPAAAH
jgi:transposase